MRPFDFITHPPEKSGKYVGTYLAARVGQVYVTNSKDEVVYADSPQEIIETVTPKPISLRIYQVN